VVSLVTEEEPYMPHAHSLTGKNASAEGIVTVQIGPEQGMTARYVIITDIAMNRTILLSRFSVGADNFNIFLLTVIKKANNSDNVFYFQCNL
jgi:hypothetical protein